MLAAKYGISYHRAYEIVRDVDGPRASSLGHRWLTRSQADRNAKIAAAYFNGVTIRKLAQQYGLTFQRIHYIVQRECARQGKTALRQSPSSENRKHRGRASFPECVAPTVRPPTDNEGIDRDDGRVPARVVVAIDPTPADPEPGGGAAAGVASRAP